PTTPGTTAYVQFTGRLAAVNQPLFKSALARRVEAATADAIRIRSVTYQVTEEVARDGLVMQSEHQVASSEVGGNVAVDAHDGRRVVLSHPSYFGMLYRKGEDAFAPAKDTNISVLGGDEPRRKTLGYRTAERTIPNNDVVSGIGIVESALVYGETGAPTLSWTLAPPGHRHLQGRPSFVVYGGQEGLVQRQERSADALGAVGLAMVMGGGYLFWSQHFGGGSKK
ncbi:hypothetical protein SDRG_15316, partial [Saprolegnia diclina VS20]